MVCPKCHSGNQDGSRFCSNCGTELLVAQPKPVKNTSRGLKIFVGVGIIFIIALLFLGKDSKIVGTQVSTATFPAELKTMIEKLQQEDVLTVKHDLNKVYIDPVYWNSMDAQKKELFAKTLAAYCAATGPNLKWVKIYDKQSAREMAEYDSWGFKAY